MLNVSGKEIITLSNCAWMSHVGQNFKIVAIHSHMCLPLQITSVIFILNSHSEMEHVGLLLSGSLISSAS